MWDLLMLGIIPGTDIQIDFTMWLKIATAFCAALALLTMVLRRLPRRLPANFMLRQSLRRSAAQSRSAFERAGWAHPTVTHD